MTIVLFISQRGHGAGATFIDRTQFGKTHGLQREAPPSEKSVCKSIKSKVGDCIDEIVSAGYSTLSCVTIV